ncbi:MAG: molybdenum cofactor guanylyltransferase [Actinomycetota bacterium]|jgi:molybdopterin-guanine dinucleotide biosynthesis protein A|nr:molybdenum cofactor guanylyltransferase [Actinomycetota bacterium]
MGRDKLSLKIGNATLIERVHGALASYCAEIVIVGEAGDTPAGLRRIPDLRPGEGPLAGIEAGLLAAQHRPVFVAAGDMPFLRGDFVGYLLALLCDYVAAVVPVVGTRPHPLCAAYGQEVRPAVSAALDAGTRSVREMLEGLPGVRSVGEEELRCFGDPNLLLMNVNSPEDLAQARAVLHGGAFRGG